MQHQENINSGQERSDPTLVGSARNPRPYESGSETWVGDSAYQARLRPLANADVDTLRTKWGEYGNSWKKRGGANAYFMLCRKFDRLEMQVEKFHFDVFEAALADGREEGILDDIGDLRRYLLLVESEARERLKAKRGAENKLPPAKDSPNVPRSIGW